VSLAVDCIFLTISKVDEVEDLLLSKMNAIRITKVYIPVNEEQSGHFLDMTPFLQRTRNDQRTLREVQWCLYKRPTHLNAAVLE
jgi:hypothetical protein